MATSNKAQILITAVNQTQGAFASIKRGLGDLGNAAKGISGILGTIGVAASAAGLGALVKSSLESADAMSKMSQKIGISVESLSTLLPVAKLAGVETEKFEGGIRKLASNMLDAATGLETAKRGFDGLGVAIQNQDGTMRATDEVLFDLVDKFTAMPDGVAKTALAMDMFGKAGTDLIPFLNQGRDGVEALREEAKALGLELSTGTAVQAEAFNDSLSKVQMATKAIGNRIIEDFLPAMNQMASGMVDSAKDGGTLRKVLDGIVGALKVLVLGAATVGKAFSAMGEILGSVFAMIASAMSGDFASVKAIFSDLKANLRQKLDELAEFRESLFNPKPIEVTVKPKIQADPDLVNRMKPKTKAGGDNVASAKLALAKAQADAELELLKDAIDRQTRELDAALDQRLVSIKDYYAAKKALELGEIDAEIERTKGLLVQQQQIAASGAKEGDRLKARAEVAKIEADLITLNNKRADVEVLNARKAADAERSLRDELTKVREELLDVTGAATSQDRRAAIERQYQSLTERLKAEGDTEGVATVSKLIDVKTESAELAVFEQQFNATLARMRATEESINIQRQAGLLSEAQSRQQILALHKETGAELDQLLPKLQASAMAIGPDALARVQAWKNEIAQVKLSVDELAPLWNRIGESFGSALNGMVSGAQTWQSAMANIFQQVSDAFLQQLVIQPFQQWVAAQARMLAMKLGFMGQEQAINAASSAATVAAKSAETTAVVTMESAKAGAGAAASQASIPFVGPGLAIAAMVAMVAAVMGLLGKAKKFASGGFVTGPGTSTSDSVPARLSAGEYVLNAAAVKRVGVSFLHSLNGLSTGPRVSGHSLAFAAGGLVPAPAAQQGQAVRIVNVIDPAMAGDYLNSSSGEKTILNILQRNAGAVQQVLR